MTLMKEWTITPLTLEAVKELSSNIPLSCSVEGGENWVDVWGGTACGGAACGVEWFVRGGRAEPLGVLLVSVPTPLLSPGYNAC